MNTARDTAVGKIGGTAGRPVLRFAPSPNGYLHVGHARSALLNQHVARQLGGVLLLRVENIDPVRCRPEFEAAMLEDLDWLGVQFDGAPRRQSAHLDTYQNHIERLTQAGLTYRCFCSRAEIANTAAAESAPRDPDGAPVYPGTCRCLDAGQAAACARMGRQFALRLRMSQAIEAAGQGLEMQRFALAPSTPSGIRVEAVPVAAAAWGDAVIARKETPTSYHVSVVVDDALQGVTHVVRGQDLEAATAIHRVLQCLWGLPEPLYMHHELIRDEAGCKLAKSLGSKSLRQLRAEGVSADSLRAALGFGPSGADT